MYIFIFSFNHCYVFDQKALRIRVRNVVISPRDSTGIMGRKNCESNNVMEQEEIIDLCLPKLLQGILEISM